MCGRGGKVVKAKERQNTITGSGRKKEKREEVQAPFGTKPENASTNLERDASKQNDKSGGFGDDRGLMYVALERGGNQ